MRRPRRRLLRATELPLWRANWTWRPSAGAWEQVRGAARGAAHRLRLAGAGAAAAGGAGSGWPCPGRQEDWRRPAAGAEQRRRWQQLLEEDRRQGFDLTRAAADAAGAGPAGGAGVSVRCGATTTCCWTAGPALVLKEVLARYQAQRRGGSVPLPASRSVPGVHRLAARAGPGGGGGVLAAAAGGLPAPTPLGVDRPAGGAGRQADDYGEERLRLPSGGDGGAAGVGAAAAADAEHGGAGGLGAAAEPLQRPGRGRLSG